MSLRITVYGGAGEIGGNKILLEDGETRIFFDFGKPFGRYGAYFDGVFVRQRNARGLLDYLSLGMLPPLRGLLREDMIPALQPETLLIEEIPPTGRQRKPRHLVELKPQAVERFWSLWKAMRSKNTCKTCALGMGGQAGGMVNESGHFPEVCKKSFQAMVGDMQGGIPDDFFKTYSIAQLSKFTPYQMEHSGRLVKPLILKM